MNLALIALLSPFSVWFCLIPFPGTRRKNSEREDWPFPPFRPLEWNRVIESHFRGIFPFHAAIYGLQLTDPRDMERLITYHVEVFTEAVVEKLNDNSFRVENG
ncbi:hypothetical protein EDD17DRAFT_1663875 [Pisolithus thermaeus]|nr:hypothetical protein EDD17DRAFT_1663875 [Pisolithus thermaeus]